MHIGVTEILLILVLALVLFGGSKLSASVRTKHP